MLEGPLALGQRQQTVAGELYRRWPSSIWLAVAIGLAYFLAALLSYDLSLQAEGLAVFWPASGVSSGFLIALGSRARWPVATGVIVAVVAVHSIMADPLRVGIAFALSYVAETVIIAGLIERYFGAGVRIWDDWVASKHNWLHCCRTVADWTRRCASPAAAEQWSGTVLLEVVAARTQQPLRFPKHKSRSLLPQACQGHGSVDRG